MFVGRSDTLFLWLQAELIKLVVKVADQRDIVKENCGNRTDWKVVTWIPICHSFVDLIDVDGATDNYH